MTISRTGLGLYLNFNTDLNDQIGDNDAAIAGNAAHISTPSDIFTRCVAHDGDGSGGLGWIEFASSSIFNFAAGDFSILMWLKPTAQTDQRGAVFASATDGVFSIDINYQLQGAIGLWTSESTSWDQFKGVETQTEAKWGSTKRFDGEPGSVTCTLNQKNAVVIRRSGDVWSIWINGVKGWERTNSYTVRHLDEAKRLFTWGDNYGFNPALLLDDFAIWKGYALSDAEIAEIYEEGTDHGRELSEILAPEGIYLVEEEFPTFLKDIPAPVSTAMHVLGGVGPYVWSVLDGPAWFDIAADPGDSGTGLFDVTAPSVTTESAKIQVMDSLCAIATLCAPVSVILASRGQMGSRYDIGDFNSDAEALYYIQANHWDDNGDGTGTPQRGFRYTDQSGEVPIVKVWDGQAWAALAYVGA